MATTPKWKKNLKKNWKIWLISALMALSLIGRGSSLVARSRRAAATPARPPAAATPQAGGQTAPTAVPGLTIQP